MTDTTTALSPEELAAREILDELNASFRFKDSHVESVGGYGEPVWVPNPAVVDIIATAIRQHSADKDRQIKALKAENERLRDDFQRQYDMTMKEFEARTAEFVELKERIADLEKAALTAYENGVDHAFDAAKEEAEAALSALLERERALREAHTNAMGQLNCAIYRARHIAKWHADPNCDVTARAEEVEAHARAAKEALAAALQPQEATDER